VLCHWENTPAKQRFVFDQRGWRSSLGVKRGKPRPTLKSSTLYWATSIYASQTQYHSIRKIVSGVFFIYSSFNILRPMWPFRKLLPLTGSIIEIVFWKFVAKKYICCKISFYFYLYLLQNKFLESVTELQILLGDAYNLFRGGTQSLKITIARRISSHTFNISNLKWTIIWKINIKWKIFKYYHIYILIIINWVECCCIKNHVIVTDDIFTNHNLKQLQFQTIFKVILFFLINLICIY
jgi:hypothetical protein